MSAVEITSNESVAIEQNKVLLFPNGIPGFEKYTKYRIFHKEENEYDVYWLESCDDPEVTFTLVDPVGYGLHYDLTLTDDEEKELEVSDPKTVAIFLMLSKKEDAKSGLNANIGGPIIINVASHKGIQKVLKQSNVRTMIVSD